MIIGTINDERAMKATFPAAIVRALEFLRKSDFSTMEDGRYEIDGDRMYATVSRYLTKPAEECRPEAHRRYADVQYLAKGQELIGWCAFTPDLKAEAPYDEAKDIIFYEKLTPESNLLLSEGSFAVLMPKDIHRPCTAVEGPEEVLKVVVKISIELLEEDWK